MVRSTESTMIFCRRSYMWPLDTVKMWMQSGSSSADSPPARPGLPLLPGANHDDILPHTDPAAQTYFTTAPIWDVVLQKHAVIASMTSVIVFAPWCVPVLSLQYLRPSCKLDNPIKNWTQRIRRQASESCMPPFLDSKRQLSEAALVLCLLAHQNKAVLVLLQVAAAEQEGGAIEVADQECETQAYRESD